MKERSVLETLRPLMLIIMALVLVAGVACGEGDNEANNNDSDVGVETDADEKVEEIALIGLWETINNNPVQIRADRWEKATIIEFNNEERWVITQNAPDAPSANKYNKILWTPIKHREFYYCMIEIGRNTLEQIKESELKADDSEPTKGGCPEGSIQTWSLLKDADVQ